MAFLRGIDVDAVIILGAGLNPRCIADADDLRGERPFLHVASSRDPREGMGRDLEGGERRREADLSVE